MSRILYLGLRVPKALQSALLTHVPLIRIQPRPFESLQESFKDHLLWTHLVFTSQTAVDLFFEACRHFGITRMGSKKIMAVGQATAKRLKDWEIEVDAVPEEETAEGILALSQTWDVAQTYVFWPHSALSRPVLTNYWQSQGIRYHECILYDTCCNHDIDLPPLEHFDEIIFTSPSTVDAFIERYGSLPLEKKLTSIGPITQAHLRSFIFPKAPSLTGSQALP